MGTDGIAKVQHYVPQFLLKNFVVGKKDHVWVFDKMTRKRFRTNVRNVAAETSFYDFDFEDATLTLEPSLGALESRVAAILRPVVRDASLESLSQQNKVLLAQFLAVQFVRTKQWREMWGAFSKDLTETLRERGWDPTKIEGYKTPTEAELKIEAARALVDADRFAPHFLDKTWVLLKATRGHPFLIGDNPIAMHNTRELAPYGNIGLAVPGIEIYLPLSKDLTLGLWCPSHEKELRAAVRKIDQIRSLDPAMAERLTAGPLNAQELLYSIDTGRAATSIRDTITYSNSLQIRHASRFVFSCTDDFELAEHMLSDDPSLMHGPRITTR